MQLKQEIEWRKSDPATWTTSAGGPVGEREKEVEDNEEQKHQASPTFRRERGEINNRWKKGIDGAKAPGQCWAMTD